MPEFPGTWGSSSWFAARQSSTKDDHLKNASGALKLGLNPGAAAQTLEVKKRPGFFGGLVNTGNTCFLNSVIQSLASLSCMSDTIRPLSSLNFEVSGALDKLLTEINTVQPKAHAYSPAALLYALHSKRWTPDTEQQDAHEFLLALLDALRTELTKEVVKQYKTDLSLDSSIQSILRDGACLSRRKSTPADDPVRIASLPFDGLMSARVSCTVCKETQSLRQQPFSSLELLLPSSSTPSFFARPIESATLDSLLDLYTAPEVLDQVYCQRCSLAAAHEHIDRLIANASASLSPTKRSTQPKASMAQEILPILTARRDAIAEVLSHPTIVDAEFEKYKPPRLVASRKTRQVTFSRAPAALALHVNRSEYDMRADIARKKNTRIIFAERIRLGRLFSQFSPNGEERLSVPIGTDECNDTSRGPLPPRAEVWYRLMSTVVHFGSHSFGHYISYRRVDDDSWVRVSDKTVRDATLDEVLAQGNVVLLFYARDDAANELEQRRLLIKEEKKEILDRMPVDEVLYDVHENDLSDGIDTAYAESSSSSSSVMSIESEPVATIGAQDLQQFAAPISGASKLSAARRRNRRRRSSSSSSTLTILPSMVNAV
ncbi:uncharacterized protein V1518DRAFT_372108 [Limtongia smithiae]|uniref:uncharacterized protein n=1 Tax=Limtongia smithiae TaxID=1125753 RepID=UPI0034CD4DDB